MDILLLVCAALSYSVGGYFMKLSDGLAQPGPTTLALMLFGLGATLQMVAMRQNEFTITYIIVLGLEAITALLLGFLLLGEGMTMLKLIGVLLVALGIIVMRI